MFDMTDWPNRHRSTLFSLGKSSSAAFHMMLCTAATHIARLQGRDYSMQSIKLKSQALVEVNRRISDPLRATTDENIESILALAVQEHLFGDLKVWQLHMSGLERVVKLRGGFQKLSLKMQAHISWIDTNVSCVLDRIPRFPLPENTMPIFNIAVHNTLWKPLQQHGVRRELLETMVVFQHLCDEISVSSIGKVLENNWLSSKFLNVSNLGARPRLNSTLHRLLRRPYDDNINWTRNERFPPIENPNNIVNLKAPMLDSGVLYDLDLEDFSLWALFVGAVACTHMGSTTVWFDDNIFLLCTRLNYGCWEQVESHLTRWFWTGKNTRDRYFDVWRRIELNRDVE
ncbi:hypothetical protein PVAG01_11292 [Phlyctema vagabunda]|uniref:Uncharacterized protein n=1 Tax=Phlyctema vagabunda TaxID=108571 RepID=A0ABR4P290_9HELO